MRSMPNNANGMKMQGCTVERTVAGGVQTVTSLHGMMLVTREAQGLADTAIQGDVFLVIVL